jgi:hypothetical protein
MTHPADLGDRQPDMLSTDACLELVPDGQVPILI